jgi:TfoX/Sxy family transcriptional regulator of competence genes
MLPYLSTKLAFTHLGAFSTREIFGDIIIFEEVVKIYIDISSRLDCILS